MVGESTILIVEDEPLVRMIAADILMDAGFDIIQTGNASEAILALERQTKIHAVFTDIDMPGAMDGLALSSLIRDRWPSIVIFVTSGKAFVSSGHLPGGSQFFIKPYDPIVLVQAFHAALSN